MSFKYKKSCVGGTFDHLHLGHKDLINTALSLSEEVSIGLATADLYRKKFLASLIEDYSTRESNIKDYLKEKRYLNRAEMVPLKDIFGPTLHQEDLQAIFVTEATHPNAVIINEKRIENGLLPLEIITVPFKKDEDGGIITSERIRLGEIDRNGHVYLNLFKEKAQLKLPASLRNKMRFPIGEIIKHLQKENVTSRKSKNSLMISVGDIVSRSLREIGCIPDVEIIDFKNQRNMINEEEFKKYKDKMYVNEPGTIRQEVVNIYKDAVRKCITDQEKQTIAINGEEDLLTIPAILLGPLHSIVYYGQFDLKAVIKVEITEQKKKEVAAILREFE
jgi:pantetheine-phosphate adenylyltransferase